MSSVQIKLNKGELLFKEGDQSDHAYLLQTGQLETFTEQDGTKLVLGQVDPGELIGEMSIIDGAPRSATIIATKKSVLVQVNKNQLIERIAESDPIVRSLLMGYSRRYRSSLRAFKGKEKLISISKTDIFDIRSTEKIQLEYQLKEAIKNKELDVRFQAILEVATDEVVGYEALIRWDHPERGPISPIELIALAEETTLIMQVGEFVLDFACMAISELIRLGTHKNPFVSINVSPKQLSNTEFIEKIVAKVEADKLPRGSIKLELTESSALAIEDIEKVIKLCHKHGINVALDNFGTGASNLDMLHELNFDTLNIDRSFTKNMHNNSRSMTLVNMIVNMGYALKADVLVAGIENEEMLDYVRELNCRYAQGYHIGKPQRLAELINETVVNKIFLRSNEADTITPISELKIITDLGLDN